MLEACCREFDGGRYRMPFKYQSPPCRCTDLGFYMIKGVNKASISGISTSKTRLKFIQPVVLIKYDSSRLYTAVSNIHSILNGL